MNQNEAIREKNGNEKRKKTKIVSGSNNFTMESNSSSNTKNIQMIDYSNSVT